MLPNYSSNLHQVIMLSFFIIKTMRLRSLRHDQPGPQERDDQPGPQQRDDQPGPQQRDYQPGPQQRHDQPGPQQRHDQPGSQHNQSGPRPKERIQQRTMAMVWLCALP